MLDGTILKQLETAHHERGQPLNLGVYYKNTLVALCHALEDFVLAAQSAPLLLAVFQKGKFYLEEADRYSQLAEKADRVAIAATSEAGFAEHPTGQKANVSPIALDPGDPLTQEWHLIILSPTYTAMVLCQELSQAEYAQLGQPTQDLERKFYGFWTFEPDLVDETAELLIAHLGRYDSELGQALEQRRQAMAAERDRREREDIGEVVSQVVAYLQDSQQALEQSQQWRDRADSFLPASPQVLDENLASNKLQAFLRMAQLVDRADVNNPNRAAEVTALSETLGQLLELPAWQQKRLHFASWLHRLVPTVGTEIASLEGEAPTCQLLPGVQSLRALPQMSAVANIITHQSECWNGTGPPGGLSHDAIPLESRILALAREFQSRVNAIRTLRPQPDQAPPEREQALAQALEECRQQAGEAFDPKLVEALELVVAGLQQGMTLEASQPKMAAGLWLLEEEASGG